MKKYNVTFKDETFTVMAEDIEQAENKALDKLGKKYGYIPLSVRCQYLHVQAN